MSASERMIPARYRTGACRRSLLLLLGLTTVCAAACSDSGGDVNAGPASGQAENVASTEDLLTSLDEQTPELRFVLGEWKGDLDRILSERFRIIRLLTVFEPMHYAVDGRKQGGITFEAAREFEKFLNRRLGAIRGMDEVRIVIVPVRRDELIPFLRDGRGDIAAANLTITEERLRHVDFSDPFFSDSYEIVVTSPGADPVESLRELSGRAIYVRRSSSYYASLERVNRDLEAQGLAPAEIVAVNEILDDGEILKLVEQGYLPATVVDAHIAEFWVQLFPNLRLHDDVRPREQTRIAMAVQKETPHLLGHLNAFVRTHKKGTLIGNILTRRYFEDPAWVEHIESAVVARRLDSLQAIFKEMADRYDLEWHHLAAQSFQESRFDQSRRSSRGAIGLMQLMPETAREMGFPDISTPEANVEAGAKYMRHIIDTWFSDVEHQPDMKPDAAAEQAFALALASYNAGPTRISRLRRVAASRGVDSDIWFGEMDAVVAREVGMEPIRYVRSIVEYSVQLQLNEKRDRERQWLEDPATGPAVVTGD